MLIPGCSVSLGFLLFEDINDNYVIMALFAMWGFSRLSKSKSCYCQFNEVSNMVSAFLNFSPLKLEQQCIILGALLNQL